MTAVQPADDRSRLRRFGDFLIADLPVTLAMIVVMLGVLLVTEDNAAQGWIIAASIFVTGVIFDRRHRRWVERHRAEVEPPA